MTLSKGITMSLSKPQPTRHLHSRLSDFYRKEIGISLYNKYVELIGQVKYEAEEKLNISFRTHPGYYFCVHMLVAELVKANIIFMTSASRIEAVSVFRWAENIDPYNIKPDTPLSKYAEAILRKDDWEKDANVEIDKFKVIKQRLWAIVKVILLEAEDETMRLEHRLVLFFNLITLNAPVFAPFVHELFNYLLFNGKTDIIPCSYYAHPPWLKNMVRAMYATTCMMCNPEDGFPPTFEEIDAYDYHFHFDHSVWTYACFRCPGVKYTCLVDLENHCREIHSAYYKKSLPCAFCTEKHDGLSNLWKCEKNHPSMKKPYHWKVLFGDHKAFDELTKALPLTGTVKPWLFTEYESIEARQGYPGYVDLPSKETRTRKGVEIFCTPAGPLTENEVIELTNVKPSKRGRKN